MAFWVQVRGIPFNLCHEDNMFKIKDKIRDMIEYENPNHARGEQRRAATFNRRAKQKEDGARAGKWNRNDVGIASQQLTSQIGVRRDDRADRDLSIQRYTNLPTPFIDPIKFDTKNKKLSRSLVSRRIRGKSRAYPSGIKRGLLHH
ncbi:unnamed protein product [Prunus armeniaca]|uniref:DUF4283 domain-containing protein n=1 Tax=Prunus armeniaca TaxID=36596 RepID=A0A6J5UBX3_PRUAR|nr:unnamed protein product [Prunus armeniaca]